MSSRSPDGGYQPTYASNLMLDGFDFDEEYGEGVLTTSKNPTTNRTTGAPAAPRSESGMAKLPDGFVTGGREAALDDDVFFGSEGSDLGNISSMVREANHLTDLSWLELAEQDPDRLPHSPNEAVIQGLVDAWGTKTRTNGVDLVPNVVVPPPPKGITSALPGDQILGVLASAMRKSAFGESFENITASVAALLGESLRNVESDPNVKKLAASLRKVRAEHGIVGRLYVRDSAFPGLLSGKWDGEIRKRCASAQYWLTRPGSKLSSYSSYLGKKVVTEIPWGEALESYRPSLEASGKRLASGDPKTVLLAALRAESVRATREASHVYHRAPADRVSSKEAREAFASAPAASREVVENRVKTVSLERVSQRFASWIGSGILEEGTAREILAGEGSPEDKLRAGVAAAAGVKKASYRGSGVGVTEHRGTRKASDDRPVDVHAPILRYATIQMNEGAAGNDLDTMLASRFSQETLRAASEQLVQIRRKHEGLAGHVYVAAEAYASSSGTTGCERGALVHRANQIGAVLKMGRCDSCSANADGCCQKYNKKLVASAPVENPERYQRETIRLANSDDSERTASMFSSYDPGEYGLQNDGLDSFEYSNRPDNQTLHGILFEGMVLPED